jgi:hypothetical protein
MQKQGHAMMASRRKMRSVAFGRTRANLLAMDSPDKP